MTSTIAGVALIVVGVAVGALALRRGRWSRSGAAEAWRTLADGLRLVGAERRLIVRMARSTGASGPAVLLVSEGCFDRAAAAFIRGDASRRSQLASIRRKVFEKPDPARRTPKKEKRARRW